MKLRNRQRHISNDIKQEDHKSDLNLINTSSSTVNETSAFSFGIKQEDTKNYKSLLQQDDKLKGKDYYYCCDRCKQTSPNLKSVIEHRASVHNIKSRKGSMINDINTEPDIHDPNFYCKSCKVIYINNHRYRQHLKIVHCMILKTIPSRRIPQNTITPDPDDPDLYCRACNYTFACKRTYWQHCRYAHGTISVKFTTARPKPYDIIDGYCKPCDRRLASKASYKRHLFAIHKLDWRQIYQKPKNRMPDVDGPNLYCRICQKNYTHRSSYRTHLRCGRHIALLSLKTNASPEKLPDSNDPHNFCSVCKISWEKRGKYRDHCRHKHFMILDRLSILNPNAMIDINHPKNYCSQCEHSYARTGNFKRHLSYVHNI